MRTRIHPELLARFLAVQDAFNNLGYVPSHKKTKRVDPHKPRGNNWNEVISKEDDDDGDTGGGGTMRGLRGKQAEYAKAAMRKLTRR